MRFTLFWIFPGSSQRIIITQIEVIKKQENLPEGDVATKVEFSYCFQSTRKAIKKKWNSMKLKFLASIKGFDICFFFVGSWKTKPKIGDSVREYAEKKEGIIAQCSCALRVFCSVGQKWALNREEHKKHPKKWHEFYFPLFQSKA